MTPDISIIIPVYNTAAYLPATIASLQASDDDITYEFVCVDDGSDDESLSILQSWADTDPRVVVLTQPNQGQSVARNTAISNAHGRWIYCLDSDDIISHDALSAAYAEASRLGVGLLLFSGDIIDESGRHIDEVANTIYTHQRYQRSEELPGNKVMTGTEVMTILLRTFSFRAVPWLYLIDAEFLKSTGIVFRPGIIHEDELFTATLIMSCHSVATLHRTLIHHRIRRSSTMGATFSRRNMDCYLTVIDGVQEWLHDNPSHRQTAWRYCAYTLNHVLITARTLPWRDRLQTLRRITRSGYLPYLEPKRLLQFIYGK
jgi:glycosyltransferase involved in cell wall biosynthesis